MTTHTTVALHKTFLLPTDRGIKCIQVEDILRIEAISNYSKLYFTNGKTLVVARVLRKFEGELSGGGFLRIHHKHLVNLQWLQTGGEKADCFLLRNGETLAASRRRKKAVHAAVTKWYSENNMAECLTA